MCSRRLDPDRRLERHQGRAHLGLDFEEIGPGMCLDGRVGAGIGAGRDEQVDDVVVDDDGGDDVGALPLPRSTIEEAVIDQDLAVQVADAGLADLAGQVLESSEGVGGGDAGRGAEPVGVGMVGVAEDHLAAGAGASAQCRVALGDEDQIALEPALDDFAAAVDRSLEAKIGPEHGEGGSTGVKLRRGRRREQLLGVLGVQGRPDLASTTRMPQRA